MKVALVLLALSLAVVGAAMVAGEQPAPLYARDIEPIFLKECGDCHGADNPKKGLDLSAGKGLEHLLGVTSQSEPEYVLVKSGDPAASYLWMKLNHTNKQGKGMPRGLFTAKKLPQEQLDLVGRWITAGAQP